MSYLRRSALAVGLFTLLSAIAAARPPADGGRPAPESRDAGPRHGQNDGSATERDAGVARTPDAATEPAEESAAAAPPDTDGGAPPRPPAPVAVQPEGSAPRAPAAAPPSAGGAEVIEPYEEDWDESDDEAVLQTNDVVVMGERLSDPAEAPVESFTVSEKELERQQPVSANDVLRRVPGVTVRSEEGMGLRPNIGFRGLSADRSRNVLVLEDGVPVQMMPYDYPELYIAPRIERMRSVEVVRGAASIIYGPRTIGGVVNFVTLQPPPEPHLAGEVRAGTGGYYFGFASAGDTIGRVGVLVTAMHQAFDGPRHLGLAQTDLMGRMSVDLHDAGELRLKLQFYDENSTSTNLGLTTLQYENGRLDNFAYHDRFPLRRYAAQVTHQAELPRDVTLATTAYFNSTSRDWWRQDFLRRSATGATYERIVGPTGRTYAPDSGMGTDDGSSVYFLDSNVGRLRQYTVAGIEPRVTARYQAGPMEGEAIAGVRLHYERGDDTDIAGNSPAAREGSTLAAQTRQVMALAAYVRPTFEFFERHLEIAPGVRMESIFSSASLRKDVTTPGGIVDGAYVSPVSTTYDPAQTADNQLLVFIPGVSAVGRVHDALSVYAGVHRGFVPPGIRDALVGGGRNVQLKPEWAWNYEAGVRGQPTRWARYELTGFYIDYLQQVLSPNVANTTPSGEVPSGSSRSYGVEASSKVDLVALADAGFELPITFAYTYARATFGKGWAPGISGNVVPYVPEHTLSGRIDFAHPIGIEAQFSVNTMSARYTDPYNLVEPTLDGTAGLIGARAVANARLAYRYDPWKSTVFVDARNLFDQRYIASRAPAGIQPGMTRQIFAGLRLEY